MQPSTFLYFLFSIIYFLTNIKIITPIPIKISTISTIFPTGIFPASVPLNSCGLKLSKFISFCSSSTVFLYTFTI